MKPDTSEFRRIEDLLARFVEDNEAGRGASIDDLCAEHPALADLLRRAHARLRVVSDAFTAFSQDDGETATDADGELLRELVALLKQPRDRASRYAIDAELAHGAMGRIYRAHDRELGRDVALKVSRSRDGDLRLERRFLEEARITGQLDHPGIVPIHELGFDAEDRPFFAMRLVAGRDLGSVIELVERGLEGWTRTRALHVLLRVCEAMAYAHSKSVVHRDLKPANVMVGRFGETYVMDWGLARVLGRVDLRDLRIDADGGRENPSESQPHTGSPLFTRDGEVIGTPAYMAPEQARGELDQVDARADVYAIGAVLYHLLAGRMPFVALGSTLTSPEVLALVLDGPPEPLAQIRSDLPRELIAVCERAMARDPAQRYATVEQLADDLRAYLEVRVVRAYEGGAWPELRKWLQRNRGLALAIGGVVLALCAGLFASTRLWRSAERNRERADVATEHMAEALERSEFERARMSLRLDDATDAETALWRQFLCGSNARSAHWALRELYSRSPCLATAATGATNLEDVAAFVPAQHAVAMAGGSGRIRMFRDDGLDPLPDLGEVGSPVQSLVTQGPTGLVVAGSADGSITIWQPADRTLVRRIAAHQSDVRALAVNPAGPEWVSGGGDGRVLLWRDLGAEPELLYRQSGAVHSARFSADGRHLATGCGDGGVVVFDWSTHESFTLLGSRRGAHAVSFARGDGELWTGGGDQRIHIWDLLHRTETATFPTHDATCRDLLCLDADTVLVGGWWRIDRWSTTTHQRTPFLLSGMWRMEEEEARKLLLTTGESRLRLFDLGDRSQIEVPSPTLTLSGNGARVALRTGDGRVVVRGLPGGELVKDLGPRVRPVRHLQFDSRGSRLLLTQAVEPLRVLVIDVDSGRELLAVEVPRNPSLVACCAMSDDGSEVAVIRGNTVVRVNVDSQVELSSWTLESPEIMRLSYSPDGKALAAVARRLAAVRCWSTRDGIARDLLLPESTCVAWSPDGTRVASGSWSGTITVVDAASGSVQLSIKTGTGTVAALAWSRADPEILVCAGGAGPVSLWDLSSGSACLTLEPAQAAPPHLLSLTDDGETLAVGGDERSVLVDLSYFDRHIAGNLRFQTGDLQATTPLSVDRLDRLAHWAEAVRARPWPRLSKW